MPQYLIAVMHDTGAQARGDVYADDAAMQEAFAKVGAFNESLGDRMVFACGLMPPEQAVCVTSDGTRTEGPADPTAQAQLGGFWIVEADDDEHALATATEGSQACGQRLEVRRLQG